MGPIAAHLNAEIILVLTVWQLDISSLSPVPSSYCQYHFCEPNVKLD